MQFEKKLIILSGANAAKGTLTLERNAFGTFAALNIFNLPDLNSGEYAAGIKSDGRIFTRNLGSSGRMLARFSIEEIPLSDVHCVIYETALESPVMYGTNSRVRLWEGNMMDGLKSKRPEFMVSGKSEKPITELPEYTKREEKLEKFFLDIVPKDSEAYLDSQIASVNYYPSEMSIEVTYSKRDENEDFTNPVDKAVAKAAQTEKLTQSKSEIKESEKVETANKVNKDKDSTSSQETQNLKSDDVEQKIQAVADKNIDSRAEEASGIDEAAFTQTQETTGEASAFAFINNLDKDEVEAMSVPPLSREGFVGTKSMELIFYEQVKEQLNALFTSNPSFEPLEKMLPDTKWAKIDYDHTGKYYVVGIVGDKPDYICYGVPAHYTPSAPAELSGYCQWLPLDETKPQGEGFWMMFQDAVTGESVKENDKL